MAKILKTAQNCQKVVIFSLSQKWWHVWLAKFLFILIFEHVVFFTQSVIQATIDDIPENVNLHVQRNRYLEKFMLFKVGQIFFVLDFFFNFDFFLNFAIFLKMLTLLVQNDVFYVFMYVSIKSVFLS